MQTALPGARSRRPSSVCFICTRTYHEQPGRVSHHGLGPAEEGRTAGD